MTEVTVEPITEPVYCSFCNSANDHPAVLVMIAGPTAAYICDGCIRICADIAWQALTERAQHRASLVGFSKNASPSIPPSSPGDI